jgi:NADH:ubiquinone oxidoreductase subunit 3 (subunit A)
MMFLLFDVEVVLLWPWVLLLYDATVPGASHAVAAEAASGLDTATLFAAAAVFFLLLAIGYVYDWGKGAFRWLA